MSLAFSSIIVVEVSDFEHAVAQIPDSSSLDATALVLRVNAQLWLELMANDAAVVNGTTELAEGQAQLIAALATQAHAVSQRAPHTRVYLIPEGHSMAAADPPYVARHGPRVLFDGTPDGPLFQPVSEAISNEIRQHELTQCIEAARSRCLICAASSYHFALPSGAHASQFLRLAEAFVDIATVDRIAYWVAHDIESQVPPLSGECWPLVVDHPSMLILAARVQRLVHIRLDVHTFPTYPSDVETRTAAFDVLRRISAPGKTVFVLIGVASTGRLARFIERWSIEMPEVTLSTTILYTLQKVADAKSLCRLDLSDYRHFASADICDLCAHDSHPVSIHTSSYMVGYGPASSVRLPPAMFDVQRPFLERWGGRPNVLRVHYDDPNESTARHHAFYVDVGTLLDFPEFQEEIFSKVRDLHPMPDAIAVPDHPTAHRIGELVGGALTLPVVTLTMGVLRGEDPAGADLAAARCVLVIDDVLISGTRLDVINRFLREQHAQQMPSVGNIHYLTLLATPASERKYRQRRSGLVGNHAWVATLDHLYKFPLPDWHTPAQCPWCKERKELSRLARVVGDLDGPLSSRLAQLNDTQHGVTDALYFVGSPDTDIPTLGSNSVLLQEGATALQVLFACASGTQQLRHADRDPLNADQFPAPAYLAERVFSEHYTERIIWLGMLRTLKGNEPEALLKSYLRRAALTEDDAQRPLVLAELAVAALLGKLGDIEVSEASRRSFEAVGIPWSALFETGLVDATP